MKRLILLLLVIAAYLLGTVSGRAAEADPAQEVGLWSAAEREGQLWDALVTPYLADPLWQPRDHYDAANLLMLPLHTAYQDGDEGRINEFEAHFARMTAAVPATHTIASAGQYFYLASRLVALEADAGRTPPAGLLDLLYSRLKSAWLVEPVKYRLAFTGLEAAVDYKLNTPSPPYLMDRAIIDREHYSFAIAADLAHYERVTGQGHELSYVLARVLARAGRVYAQEVVRQPGGGWLLQPGVWSKQQDYLWAGRTEKTPGMKYKPVPGIGVDSSHSHRLPLWLRSLAGAYPDGSAEQAHYQELLGGLEVQLLGRVIEPPAGSVRYYRLRNYMDGTNGIFRWGYPTLGPNQGYGPYEMSGTLLYGWWSFLGSGRVSEVYRRTAYQFPLDGAGLAVYSGPQSSREMHPTVRGFLSNGYAELLARLAGR